MFTSIVQNRLCTFNYDTNGNLAGYSDDTTLSTSTYDDLGRNLTKAVNYGPFIKIFSHTYYGNDLKPTFTAPDGTVCGNGLKKTFTAPDGTVYTYNYGTNNELREVQIPSMGSITIPAYTWNRPATINYPGGTQRTYTYDALMRLQYFTALDPTSNSILDYAYTYDEVGNILTKTTEHGNYSYGYNDVSRLLSADNPMLTDESYTGACPELVEGMMLEIA